MEVVVLQRRVLQLQVGRELLSVLQVRRSHTRRVVMLVRVLMVPSILGMVPVVVDSLVKPLPVDQGSLS